MKIKGFLETKFTNYNSIIIVFLKLSIIASFCLFFCYYWKGVFGTGDENLFITDLNFIKSNGWIAAIESKIGLTFLILVYPFSLFLENYLAFRLVNVILFVGLLYYFKKNKCSKNSMFFYYIIFFSILLPFSLVIFKK